MVTMMATRQSDKGYGNEYDDGNVWCGSGTVDIAIVL
jgi:hypothetical protein